MERFGSHVVQFAAATGTRNRILFWRLPTFDGLLVCFRDLLERDIIGFSEVRILDAIAWNDLFIWGRERTEDAILHEILERGHPDNSCFTRKRWKSMLDCIRREGYAPTGFGKATAIAK